MKNLFALLATVFALTLALSGTARAACSLEGIYKGTWSVDSYGGLVELTVDTKWGFRYVTLRTSKASGGLMPGEDYLRTGKQGTVEFSSRYGLYSLQLQQDCQLTGIQHNKGQNVTIQLQKVGNTPRQSLPQIMSSQAAVRYLDGKTYRGNWQWGKYSGSRALSFASNGRCLTAQVVNQGDINDTAKPVCVETSNGWVKLIYSRGGNTTYAWVTVASSGRHAYTVGYGQSQKSVMFIQMQLQ